MFALPFIIPSVSLAYSKHHSFILIYFIISFWFSFTYFYLFLSYFCTSYLIMSFLLLLFSSLMWCHLYFIFIFPFLKIWWWRIYVVLKPLTNLFTLKMVGSCTSRHLLCGAAILLLFVVVLFYSINYFKLYEIYLRDHLVWMVLLNPLL